MKRFAVKTLLCEYVAKLGFGFEADQDVVPKEKTVADRHHVAFTNVFRDGFGFVEDCSMLIKIGYFEPRAMIYGSIARRQLA